MQCIADGQGQIPPLTMTLGHENLTNGKVSFTKLCDGDTVELQLLQLAASRKNRTNNGLHRVTVLFQNSFRQCIPVLDQVTSFRFQSMSGAPKVSFCMDDISLLPSTLQPAGELASRQDARSMQHMLLPFADIYVPTRDPHLYDIPQLGLVVCRRWQNLYPDSAFVMS